MARACCVPNTCRPRRPVGRKAHPAPMITDRAFSLNESEPSTSTQFRTNAIPAPPFTKNPCEAQGLNCATASRCVVRMFPCDGVDRHPEHFGADVHARIDTISDIDQHGASVAVRESPPRRSDNRRALSRTRRRPQATRSRRRRPGPAGSTVPAALPGRTPGPGRARARKGRAPTCASRSSRQAPREVGAHLRVVVACTRAGGDPGRTSVDRSTHL